MPPWGGIICRPCEHLILLCSWICILCLLIVTSSASILVIMPRVMGMLLAFCVDVGSQDQRAHAQWVWVTGPESAAADLSVHSWARAAADPGASTLEQANTCVKGYIWVTMPRSALGQIRADLPLDGSGRPCLGMSNGAARVTFCDSPQCVTRVNCFPDRVAPMPCWWSQIKS